VTQLVINSSYTNIASALKSKSLEWNGMDMRLWWEDDK